MLFVDGSEISELALALGDFSSGVFLCAHEETLSRSLGDELSVLQAFLAAHGVTLEDISAFGVVRGPGSAGALRSTLSLVNAVALAREKEVFSVARAGGVWTRVAQEHAYALPVYDRPAHTTVSHKDALKRSA